MPDIMELALGIVGPAPYNNGCLGNGLGTETIASPYQAEFVMEESQRDNDTHKIKLDIINALEDLADEARREVLRAAAAFYEINLGLQNGRQATHAERDREEPLSGVGGFARDPVFSDHQDQSPKQFLEEKQPHSDVDRVACLAYYLSHYRNTPHFKTIDISKLNMEAAQLKFSNAAFAVNNAAQRGILTSAGKSRKQISAFGERFVAALPDREAAKKVLQAVRRRRNRGNPRSTRPAAAGQGAAE